MSAPRFSMAVSVSGIEAEDAVLRAVQTDWRRISDLPFSDDEIAAQGGRPGAVIAFGIAAARLASQGLIERRCGVKIGKTKTTVIRRAA